MSERPTTCDTGCTSLHQHRPDAIDHNDTCPGCLPRDAEVGRLCAWCWQRLNRDVSDMPGLVRHLREMAQPTVGSKPPGDGRGHGDPAEGGIVSAAVDAADDLHASLASWAECILEDHPDGERMAGPDERGVWRTHAVTHWVDGEAVSRRSQVVGIRDTGATTRLVAWITPLLEWCASQEWAAEMRRHLGEQIATTRARWPEREHRTRPVRGIPCPRCAAIALTYTPPSWATAPFVVACTNAECGRVFSEDEWERLVSLVGRTTVA